MNRMSLKMTIALAAPIAALVAGCCLPRRLPRRRTARAGHPARRGSSTANGGNATSGGTTATPTAGHQLRPPLAPTRPRPVRRLVAPPLVARRQLAAGTDAAGGRHRPGTGTGGGSAGAAGGGACDLNCVAGVKNDSQDALTTTAFIMVGCYSKAAQDCITIPAGTQLPQSEQRPCRWKSRASPRSRRSRWAYRGHPLPADDQRQRHVGSQILRKGHARRGKYRSGEPGRRRAAPTPSTRVATRSTSRTTTSTSSPRSTARAPKLRTTT